MPSILLCIPETYDGGNQLPSRAYEAIKEILGQNGYTHCAIGDLHVIHERILTATRVMSPITLDAVIFDVSLIPSGPNYEDRFERECDFLRTAQVPVIILGRHDGIFRKPAGERRFSYVSHPANIENLLEEVNYRIKNPLSPPRLEQSF